MTLPAQHNVKVRQLLSTILTTWQQKPDCYYHAQLALKVAALAGAEDSAVPFEAVGQANEILYELWFGRVSKKDAQAQLEELLNERRNENV